MTKAKTPEEDIEPLADPEPEVPPPAEGEPPAEDDDSAKLAAKPDATGPWGRDQ